MKLVFSGSGTNYPLFVGAYKALYQLGHRLEGVAGTSGGAIIAALLASGYDDPRELERVVLEFLPAKNNLIDWAPFSFWQGGLIDGDRILKKMKKVYKPKFENTTVPCYITATNINNKQTYIFDSHTSPQISLPEVVRASMAIPFVFKPVQITGFGDDYFIDGGVGNNFPIDTMAGEVFGFRSLTTNPIYVKNDHVHGPIERGRRIIDIFQEAINQKHIEDADYKKIVNLYGFKNSFKINMNEDECKRLIQQGYEQTLKKLKG
ncbi:MAG: hypothetical protein CL489_16615 [Acidobacteria bacterium]|nr:hypothetical protein [Acidobacteriota bacterium]|tara:strand:+ start:814 stop:1602 length:789 start_codon:yes stop_codon:yes gene_type:complete